MSELDELRELYPNLRLIPDDVLSGYHLETDADAYQLHQLYDVLGLEIIAKCASRQATRWPGQPLFVSSLRKRYRRRLPRDFYRVGQQSWVVYLLVSLEGECAKIGMSSDVLRRAMTLSGITWMQPEPPPLRFDFDVSLVIADFKIRAAAAAAERVLLENTRDLAVQPPDWTCYYCNGKNEWRNFGPTLIERFRTEGKGLQLFRVTQHLEANPRLTMLDMLG